VRAARTKRKLKRKVPFILCCLVLLGLLAAGGAMAWNSFFSPQGPTIPSVVDSDEGKRLNVLLLGIDPRDGEAMSRTDTIIVASMDTRTKQMALLSIPRDTRVNIPGHGWDKINSASVYGGPELTMRVVSDLLGTPMRYYVLANFNGFKSIVDALGGVTLDVEENMYHEDEPGYGINLRAGVQRLDGAKAIQYVRYRGYVSGDIERTQHQQKFLMALGREMLQPGAILKLPALIPEVKRYVKTNLTIENMYQLATAAKKLEGAKMVAQTLPGVPVNIGDGSYWGVDPYEARRVLAKLYNGETLEVVQNTTITPQMMGVSNLHQVESSVTPAEDETKPPAGKARLESAIPGAQGQSGSQGGKPGAGTGGKLPPGSVVITPGGTGAQPGTQPGAQPGKTGTETETGDPGSTGSETAGSGTAGGSGADTGGISSGATTGSGGATATQPGSSGTDVVDPAIPVTKTGTVL
jgi:LCP family protein required for cell wall assembly